MKGSLPCPRPGNRGRGRGEVFQTLQWFSGKGRAFSNRGQKGTFPDYNNYPGMKRGQSPVVPFFRGGEGDGTFNGFVLSTFTLFLSNKSCSLEKNFLFLKKKLLV